MNVFLVTSPFQYICANEAREVYQTRNNLLVLIEQDNPIGKKQMSSLLEEKNWDIIIRYPRNNRTKITPLIINKINKLSQGHLQCLFYSEYQSWRSKLIIRNLSFNKHIFFDDGTMTFFDYYDYIEPKLPFYRPRWVQDYLLKFKGIKPIGKLEFFENTEVFSIFNFPNCHIKYKENTLNILRKKIHSNKKELAYFDVFIGQGSIDEKGRISVNDYISSIKTAINDSPSQLLYIPHRTEAKHVSSEIKRLKGIIYHHPTFPIELELIEHGVIPKTIIGLSSTALYTLSKIYPESTIRLIEQNCIASTQRDNRIQSYLLDYFHQRSIHTK
ncbi:hypothetical protein [Vibrio quintilis]|uniref:Glycosyltransferase 52 family protein n=1 Tax=Vibrio quintilis TaxID=1117707 RepID=A0A1M7YYG1_9VIBR|nr:hypothetical protein [Vibrio quintilis]SHO57602.1 hypothetical protein VQ7734_03372 [Vibrio quintilis]